MAQRRSHVERAANLAFEQHIIASEMNFGGLSGSLQLLQMTVAEFVLFVALVADGLRVRDAFGNGRATDCYRLRRGVHF